MKASSPGSIWMVTSLVLVSLGCPAQGIAQVNLVEARSFAALGEPLWSLEFSTDARLFAALGHSGGFGIWETRSLAPVLVMTSDEAGCHLNNIDLADEGRLLTGSCRDGRIIAWDTSDGDRVFSTALAPSSHEEELFPYLDVSPDGRYVAVAVEPAQVVLLSPKTGEVVARIQAHVVPLTYVKFSPDSRVLLVVDAYNAALFEVPSLRPIAGLPGEFWEAEFAAGGRWLVTQRDDITKIWDTRDGAMVYYGPGHPADLATRLGRLNREAPPGDVSATLWAIAEEQSGLFPPETCSKYAWTTAGALLVTGGRSLVCAVDLRGRTISEVSTKPGVGEFAVDVGGTVVAAAEEEGTVIVWKVVWEEAR